MLPHRTAEQGAKVYSHSPSLEVLTETVYTATAYHTAIAYFHYRTYSQL